MMKMVDDSFMDKASRIWERFGRYFAHRPAQICGLLLGCLILVIVIAVSSITFNNRKDISQIKHAFCNNSGPYTQHERAACQHLLDQLLKNPTPEQARRLREIVVRGQR
jgi:hypothetical protein